MPHKNIRTIARLSLVAVVAGSFGIAPVSAQEQASLTDASLPTFPSNPNATLTPGSGSANARYSSAGWTYTAVAFNPANERVYAISTGDGGKEAGHLLRFQPNSKRVTDLGLLELDDVQADKIVSAAFTSRGQLVLFSGAKFRVLDLSEDFKPTAVNRTADIEVTAHELKLEDGIGDIGLPSAWASVGKKSEADTLYAVTRSPEDEYFKWTLDVTTGKVEITQLEVAPNLRLDEIGALNYAYTKDTKDSKDGATLVFADDKARSLEVVGNTIRASYFGGTVVDNFRELSYLPTGAPYQPVTKFNTPASPASQASQPSVEVDAGAPVPPADDPAPSLPTTVEDATEPTASPNAAAAQDAHTQDAQADADAAQAQAGEDRDVKFTVMNERGHAVSGAGIEIVGVDASAKTDRNGQAALSVPGDDVLAMVDGEPVVIDAGESRIRVTLNSDSKTNAGTENTTSGTLTTTGTRSIPVVVQDNAGRNVAGATIEGTGEMAGKTFTSNSAGLVMVEVPASANAKTLTFTASKDGVQAPFDLSTDTQSATVQLSANAQSGSQQGGPQHRDSTILVRVVTDGGDPVQFAEVYSPGRPEVRVNGSTDANGYVKVLVPANSGTSQTVRLAVRNAPSGYKTVDKQVNRYEDDVTLTLSRASTSTSSTKSKPDEVMEVVKEVESLMKELAGPAAIGGAFLRGQRGGASTTRSASATPLPLSGTATSTTSTTGSSADSTAGASDSNVRMVNRTTSVSTTAAPAPTRSLYNYDKDTSDDSDSTQSTRRSRDGDLANTGTPMTTVIVLGILAMLLGGAYLMISRRRER